MSSEPHNTTRPEPEPEPEGNSAEPIAEPVPVWDHALETWGWAWQLHWAGLGTLFFLLALYALLHVHRIVGKGWKPRRLLALVVNCLLVLFGLSRALFLFINPYESDECHVIPTCPVILTRILFGIGLPCLTAAFSLIHLTFLQMTKLKLYPTKLQRGKFIFSIIIFHFTLAIVTELVVSLYADGRALSIACQSFFIITSFTLSTSYIYSGTKILSYVRDSSSQIQNMGGKVSVGCPDTNEHSKAQARRPYRPNVSKLVKITYISVFLGFASCALQLYSIFHIYNMYSGKNETPEPWPWFVFQTLFRLVELAAGCTMAYVSPRQFESGALNELIAFCNRCTRRSVDSETAQRQKVPTPPATEAVVIDEEDVVITMDTRL